jgi:pimeloyl-ACP methyl ester carboxylesterase
MLVPHFSTLGSGPTVLMLHDATGGHLSFAPQLETFAAAGYRAVAWDMPGYGHSAPIEPYTFKGLAQSCIALIDALQARSAHAAVVLLGQGMGGMLALEVTARRPDLVQRLVLAGTAAAFEGGSDAGERFVHERTAPLARGHSMQQLARALMPTWVGSGHLPEGVRLAEHCMAQVHEATYHRALQALVCFDRRASLAAIACPVLVIAGEQDAFAPPAAARALAAALAHSDYVQLKGVGQLANLEAPDEFDAAVLNWLALSHDLQRVLH